MQRVGEPWREMGAGLPAQSAPELVLSGHPVEARVVARDRERQSQALVAHRRELLVVAVDEVVRPVVDLSNHLVDGTRVVDVDGVARRRRYCTVCQIVPSTAPHPCGGIGSLPCAMSAILMSFSSLIGSSRSLSVVNSLRFMPSSPTILPQKAQPVVFPASCLTLR